MPELPRTAFKTAPGGTLLRCRVQPGASRAGVVGSYGNDCVKIALQSPPTDGRANQELCRMLAERCGIPRGRVTLKSGAASRDKSLIVEGVSPEKLHEILSESC